MSAGRAGALTILFSGMVAGDPHQGGATWAVLQYVLGLRRLGHEVVLVEEWTPPEGVPEGPLGSTASAAYFRAVAARFGLEGSASLLRRGTRETAGVPYERLREAAARADVLFNVSGLLTDPELIAAIPVRAYLDLDPAFNQVWDVQGIDMRFGAHNRFVTVGLALGRPGCPVPTGGREWIATLQPVVLEHWPAVAGGGDGAFTSVGNWRGYGSVEHEGVHYGQRVHSMRRFVELPRRSGARFRLALAIHPDETRDLEALAANGWVLVDPREAAGTPDRYAKFIRGSGAELGIAKSGYVESRCAWFSDRSACYLASGRPVLAQDTGFADFLPAGEGLLAFATLDDAVAGVEAIRADHALHSRRARELAEEHLDSDRVLGRLLDHVFAQPAAT